MPNIATVGSVNSSSDAFVVGGGTVSKAVSTVSGVILLKGLIKAESVKVVSTTMEAAGQLTSDAEGSGFSGLTVLGLPVSEITANKKINIPGVGYVILNETNTSGDGKSKQSLAVNMIHVKVTLALNILGLPVGTEIVVGHAYSGMEEYIPGFGDGTGAFGAQISIAVTVPGGSTVLVSPGPLGGGGVSMPCVGTGGQIQSSTLASINVPGVLTSGTVENTAQGTTTANSAAGETTSSLQSVNIAQMITAGVVKADTHVSTNGSSVQLSDEGSRFEGLSIAGHPEINADVTPNTKVELPGLGTLWLRRVIRTSTSIEVRMLELIVSENSSSGLSAGSTIQIGVARAAAP